MNPNLNRKYESVIAQKTMSSYKSIKDSLNDYNGARWIYYDRNIYLSITDIVYKSDLREKPTFRERDIEIATILGNLGKQYSPNDVYITKDFYGGKWTTKYYVTFNPSLIGGIKMSDIRMFERCGFNVFGIVEDSLYIIVESDENSKSVKIKFKDLQKNNIKRIANELINSGFGGDV